ncbi:MAG: hypothetical protein AB1Z63_09510 [Candidatus Limnocylindrales bacterium]
MTSSRDNEPAIIAAEEPRTRRQLLTAGGAAAVMAALGAVGISSNAEARDGQWTRLGRRNTATSTTQITAKKSPGFLSRLTGGGAAIRGITSSQKGVGIQGWADAKKGKTVGVAGKSGSPAGTAGQFIAGRGGTAVVAKSPDGNGVALETEGKLRFGKRSGEATTSGGSEFVIPVSGGLSKSSLVIATLQDHFPGVHVESAAVLDAGRNTIVVRLNQAVPEPARVAWIVLD